MNQQVEERQSQWLSHPLRSTLAIAFCLMSSVPSTLNRSICFAQAARRKTVLDYYLLLPDKYFEVNREERVKWMLDPRRGAIVDFKHGYLYAPGDGAQTDVYVALFKRSDGTELVGVKTHAPDTDEFTYLDFYAYQNKRWRDVTKSVLPTRIYESLVYEIPRYGRTIKVSEKHGRRLYELVWAFGRFRLRRSR